MIASTGFGNSGSTVRGDGSGSAIRCFKSSNGLPDLRARRAAEQDVAQDQPERVDVGALIDGLTASPAPGAM